MSAITIPVENMLAELRDATAPAWADRVQAWLDESAPRLDAAERADLLIRTETWSRVPALSDDRVRVAWLLDLLGRWPAPDLESKGWPAPIQSRIDRREQAPQARVSDAVHLYEVFLHFHFAALASEFMQAAEALESTAPDGHLPAEAQLGWRVLEIAITDARCNGGAAWLERSAALTWVLERMSRHGKGPALVFPELVGILEPRHLRVRKDFGRFKGEMVVQFGPAVRLFDLLRRFRNLHRGHAQAGGDALDPGLAQGLTNVFGLLGRHFEPYRTLALAEAGFRQAAERDEQVVLTTLWSPEGRALRSTNQAVAGRFKALGPSLPGGGYGAPPPPALREWQLEWWDRSLLLLPRESPPERWLYLMPWACRLEARTDTVVPGLLESVHWRSEGQGKRYPRAQWRSYVEAAEGDRAGAAAAEAAPSAAQILQALAYRAQRHATAGEPAAAAGESLTMAEPARRDFVLGLHAARAREQAAAAMPRPAALQALLDAALAERKQRRQGAARLMLVGQSGVGKSSLLVQAFVANEPRASLISLDCPLVAEVEPRGPSESTPVEGGAGPLQRVREVPQLGQPRPALTVAVPARMHWVAALAQAAGRPAPRHVLTEDEARVEIRASLRLLAQVDPRPVWLMVDGINQSDEPLALLNGLGPLDDLPANAIVVVSTQDNEKVMRSLEGSDRSPEHWCRIDLQAMDTEEVGRLFWHRWPDGLDRPGIGNDTIEQVWQRSKGFPFYIRHWSELLQTLAREEPARAAARFRRELKQGGSDTLYPKAQFRRLVDDAERDFTPPDLPRIVLWCLSAAGEPLSVSDLVAVMPGLVKLGFAKASASRSEIQDALGRIGGHLSTSVVQGVRRYRFMHEQTGEVWLQEFGTAEEIARLNELLLAHGARPLVHLWPAEACVRWATWLLDSDVAARRLGDRQKKAIITGLLARMDHVDGGLEALRPRRLGFWAESIFYQRQEDPACAVDAGALRDEADRALRMLESAAAPSSARLEDASIAFGTLAFVEWQQKEMALSQRDYEQALRLRERLLLQPDQAPDLARARYLGALRNVAIVQERNEGLEAALQTVAAGWSRCPLSEGSSDRLHHAQADLLGLEAWLADASGNPARARECWREAAHRYRNLQFRSPESLDELAGTLVSLGLAASEASPPDSAEGARAFGEAIRLYRQLQGKSDDARGKLADALHNFALSLPTSDPHREDLDCLVEAIDIYRELLATVPTVRLSLANALHNYAGRLQAADDVRLRLECCEEAISLYEAEIDPSQQVLRWRANSCHAAGVHLRSLNDHVRAADRFRQAEQLRRGLVESGQEDLRSDLFATLDQLASTLLAAQEPSEAADVLLRAADERRVVAPDDPLVWTRLQERAACLADAGRMVEWAAAMKEVALHFGAKDAEPLAAHWDAACRTPADADARAALAQSLVAITGDPQGAVRLRSEACLPEAMVLELGIDESQPFARQRRYLWRRELLLPLLGHSEPLHLAALLRWVRLADPESVTSWLRLFCESLCASGGAFLLPASPADIPWLPEAGPDPRAEVQTKWSPLTVTPDEEGYRAVGHTFYGAAMYEARFLLRGSRVEMIEDTTVIKPLPVYAVQCREGVWQCERHVDQPDDAGEDGEPGKSNSEASSA